MVLGVGREVDAAAVVPAEGGEVVRGVLASECAELLRRFFAASRDGR